MPLQSSNSFSFNKLHFLVTNIAIAQISYVQYGYASRDVVARPQLGTEWTRSYLSLTSVYQITEGYLWWREWISDKVISHLK